MALRGVQLRIGHDPHGELHLAEIFEVGQAQVPDEHRLAVREFQPQILRGVRRRILQRAIRPVQLVQLFEDLHRPFVVEAVADRPTLVFDELHVKAHQHRDHRPPRADHGVAEPVALLHFAVAVQIDRHFRLQPDHLVHGPRAVQHHALYGVGTAGVVLDCLFVVVQHMHRRDRVHKIVADEEIGRARHHDQILDGVAVPVRLVEV